MIQQELTINLIDGVDAFAKLANEWDTLVSKSMTNTPFQLHTYQKSWWDYLHPENGTLHTITVRDSNDQLIGIASLYLIEGILYFNGCVEETDYLDLISSTADAEAVWTAVFDCLCSSEFPEWHGLSLCNIPEASPSRTILPQIAAKRGFSLQETINEVCPIIPLPETFDDYLAQIDSKQRREIKRKLRRAFGADAQLVQVSQEDDITEAVDTFLELLQKSTFEKRDWLNEGRTQLFHTVAKAAQEAGTLQLLFMEVDGQKAAALFNFNYNGRIWVYNSGLDPDKFGNLSLGVVISAKAIELGIEQGAAEFDFLRGNETYKYRFGAQDTTIYRIEINR